MDFQIADVYEHCIANRTVAATDNNYNMYTRRVWSVCEP